MNKNAIEAVRPGEMEVVGHGRLILRGRPLAIFRWIDSQFESMAVGAGATVIEVPVLIKRDVLARAGFFEAFGDIAVRPGGNGGGEQHLLSPALCYHAYASLADRSIDTPVRLTTVGKCYRNENREIGENRETRRRSSSPISPNSLCSFTRLNEFTMREIIFLGADQWIRDERSRWMSRVSAFAASLGLASDLVVATDSFFLGAERGKKLLQQVKELKFELRMPIGDESAVAVASMNLHETFFGSRFELRSKDGSRASSCCVAFGIERWTLAMIAQLGIDRAVEIAGCRATL